MFKEKIASALKTKYQRFGLSNEAVDRIASAREKTVTSEEEIETAVADVETMTLIATEVQKMRDMEIQKRTDTQRAFDTYKEKNPEAKTPETKPEEPKETEPEWARRLREQNERIEAWFQTEAKARRLSDSLSKVEAGLRESGCTNPGILKATLKGFALKEGETEDSAVERLKGEYNSSYKDTFGEGPVPGLGGQAFGDAKTAISKKNDFLREQGLLPNKDN